MAENKNKKGDFPSRSKEYFPLPTLENDVPGEGEPSGSVVFAGGQDAKSNAPGKGEEAQAAFGSCGNSENNTPGKDEGREGVPVGSFENDEKPAPGKGETKETAPNLLSHANNESNESNESSRSGESNGNRVSSRSGESKANHENSGSCGNRESGENKAENAAKARQVFSRLGLALLALVVVNVAVEYLMVFLIQRFFPSFLENQWCSWALSILPLYGFAMPAYLLFLRRIPKQKIKNTKKLRLSVWLLLLLIAYGLTFVGSILGNALMGILGALRGTGFSNAVSELMLHSNIWITLLFACVVAPIGEEFLFRKCIVDRARPYGEKTCILLSGLFFGLFHGNFFQFFFAFFIGMLFALIYVKTGKLRYSIAMHATINTVSTLSSLLLRAVGYTEMLKLETNAEQMAYIAEHMGAFVVLLLYEGVLILTMITGLVLFVVYRKRLQANRCEIPLPRGGVAACAAGNAGMPLAFLGMVGLFIIYFINH